MARGQQRQPGEYVKGVTTHVFKADAQGFPLDSIERDTDGNFWHVVEGEDNPTRVRDEDEIRAIAAESENKADAGGNGQ